MKERSSILGGSPAAPSHSRQGVEALGPSDSSDSGSDTIGEGTMVTGADNAGEWGAMPVDTQTDSDSMGTGERASATGRSPRDGADLMPDHLTRGDQGEVDADEIESLAAESDDDMDADSDEDRDDEIEGDDTD